MAEKYASFWVHNNQCLKHLCPVKTMAIPCSLHASITSSSRTEPPGCRTAFIPLFDILSILSLNGKNASEHRIEPCMFSQDFFIAMSNESTLLTCPAPTPRVVLSFTIRIPFDFMCFKTFHPNSIVSISDSEGLIVVTVVRSCF